MFTKKSAIEKLDAGVKLFEKAVQKTEAALEQIRAERDANEVLVTQIKTQNALLTAAESRGERRLKKLNELLG